MSSSDLRAEDDQNPAGFPGEAEQIGFAAAMAELNEIVSDLESDRLDVDVLADRVERAAFLVGMCRDRLDATKLRVEEIIVRLDGPD